MRAMIALALLALTACSSAAKDAEKEYDMVAKNRLSTSREQCAAATKVSDAYLAEHDQQQYERWQRLAGSYCSLDS